MDLGELYQQYAADVHRFAYFLSGDAALAEDITSETFIRAWTARERIRLPTVKAYLFTIARHLYLQGRRRERGREELADEIPDGRERPDRAAEVESDLRHALAALRELPEPDRAALLLRAEEGLSYEEIAAALGISAAAARVKVHRARLRLAGGRAEGGGTC